MNKIIFCIIGLLFSSVLFSDPLKELDAQEKVYFEKYIAGVWDYNPVPYDIILKKEFSWGTGIRVIYESIIFDYGIQGDAYINVPQVQSEITQYQITAISKESDSIFIVTLYSYHFSIYRKLVFHFIDLNTVWFETEEQYLGVDENKQEFKIGEKSYGYAEAITGRNRPYYRIAAPPDYILKFGIVNSNNLRIREAPNLSAKTIGHLNDSQIVSLLDKTDQPMKIEDMNSNWYKIRTEAGIVGWSYGFFIDILPDPTEENAKKKDI